MRRNIASCLSKARFAITTRHGPPAHVRECSRLPCPFHQTCHLTCGHAPRRKAAFWKAPRFCCSTSTRIRIDWTCLVLTLLLKHLGIPGRAKATMPGRQADPDQNQKSARQRNQTKRPGSRLHCGCHSDGTCGAGRPAMAAQSSFVEIFEWRGTSRSAARVRYSPVRCLKMSDMERRLLAQSGQNRSRFNSDRRRV